MKDKAMIEQMARETGLSIEEATKALNGLNDKGLLKPSGKKFPFFIDMQKVSKIVKGFKNGNCR